MISQAQARELVAFLSAKYKTTVVYPNDPARVIAQALLDSIAHAMPLFRDLANQLAVRVKRVSVTIPTPKGAMIAISPNADENAETLAETGAHEHQHAVQENRVGTVQVIVDYLEPELRAQREAEAYSVSLAVRWFLTGNLPTIDDAVASLSSDTYLLPAEHIELARGILRSNLATMENGLCPPITVAVDVLEWLRSKHPDMLLAKVA